jgi:LysR family glycine cleavage system transcriptional activator
VHVYRVGVREAAEHLLSITAGETFASNWLVTRLGKFQLAHPNLTVRFETTGRMVDFTCEEFDVGIRGGSGCWPSLKAHELLPVEFTPLCSPEFLDRAGNLSSPADLLRLPLLDWADDWWRRWFALAGIADPKPAPHPAIQCDVQAMLGLAAMAGQGVAILMPAFFAAEIAVGRLVQPFDLVARSELSYWLVYSEDRQNSPKIVAFREWILQEIGRDLKRITSANQP